MIPKNTSIPINICSAPWYLIELFIYNWKYRGCHPSHVFISPTHLFRCCSRLIMPTNHPSTHYHTVHRNPPITDSLYRKPRESTTDDDWRKPSMVSLIVSWAHVECAVLFLLPCYLVDSTSLLCNGKCSTCEGLFLGPSIKQQINRRLFIRTTINEITTLLLSAYK